MSAEVLVLFISKKKKKMKLQSKIQGIIVF